VNASIAQLANEIWEPPTMPVEHRFDACKFWVDPNSKLDLSKRSTKAGKELVDKKFAAEALAADVSLLQAQQELLFATKKYALLVIVQGMDTAGKDGMIRHVMGGVNPQGCRVYSFGPPNSTEQMHHFLWRPTPYLPEKGMISLFNRSYYEEVIAVRIHPRFLEPQSIPGVDLQKPKSLDQLWKRRFKEIRAFEQTLHVNGTLVLKFFLHLSHKEQRNRLLSRLREQKKFWKFNPRDMSERKLWSRYQEIFQACLQKTSSQEAPWFVIPADNKWYARAAIADIIAARLEDLQLSFPEVSEEQKAQFSQYIEKLESE
jgi:PPK2 family polyphosphate:nucleotide phosphotransferase